MTPDTGRPTDRDYLWDPSSVADRDVEAVERSLESLRFEHRQRPLVLPARPRVRWRRTALAIAAGVVMVIGTSAVFWQWRESWPSGRAWPVTVLKAQTSAPNASTLVVDRTLQLDANATADVDIARIGAMRVSPGSALTLSETGSARHRIVLDRGEVSVRVWAPPQRFAIRTPAGEVIDLGCIFDLSVDPAGETALHVKTGWVELGNFLGESLIPAGASATMTRDARPSAPVYDDASPEFKAAVHAFEAATDDVSRTALVAQIGRGARPRDVITLLMLANTTSEIPRRALLELAVPLKSPPAGVTVDRILAERDQLWVWYDALDLPPAKSWWRNWRDAFPRPRR